MRQWALFIGSILIPAIGFCAVGEFSGETTCYIYQQDKLQKKLTCPYEGAEGVASTYGFRQVIYWVPGYGVMATSDSIDGYDADGYGTGRRTTVNEEPAIIRYRSATTQRVISDSDAQSSKKALECYLSTKSQWEICTE